MKKIISLMLCAVILLPLLLACSVTVESGRLDNSEESGDSTASGGYTINNSVSAENATKVTLDEALNIAKKYYRWASPIIELDMKSEFDRVINWSPAFDGKNSNIELANSLSCDVVMLGASGCSANLTVATACAVFDLASGNVTAAQNLSCAIAMFSDNNKDLSITAKESEIYADAEIIMLYAIYISIDSGKYTAASLEPLACLGNLYLDMNKNEQAHEKFEILLNICTNYMPAIEGMINYYKAVNETGKIAEMLAVAAQNPSAVGRAGNEIDKNNNQTSETRGKNNDTEEKLEIYLEELTHIEATSYADIFWEIDPEACKDIKDSLNALYEKLTITIPNISILTQYTDINEDKVPEIEAAQAAVGKELEALQPYRMLYAKQTAINQTNMLEGMGVDIIINGMTLSQLVRDMMANPQKYKDFKMPEIDPEAFARAYAEALMGKAGQAMAGDDSGMTEKLGETDPLYAVLSINPFDYANAFDILIQQYNVKPLMEKMNALGMYMTMVNGDTTQALFDIKETYLMQMDKILEGYNEAYRNLQEWYYKELDRISREYASATDSARARAYQVLADEYKDKMHKIHEEYYPRFNDCMIPYWHQATQVASMAYKKLEDNVPKMYQAVMKHIVAISDPLVQEDQENKLMGMIGENISLAITNVMTSYSIGALYDIRQCGCDPDELAKIRSDLTTRKAQVEKEYFNEQNAKWNSFKSGEIDQNSSFYKDYIKKYEYSVNLIFYKYRTNDHFTVHEGGVWSPFGSFDAKAMTNHISGNQYRDVNVTLGLESEGLPVKGKASFGISYVRDKYGKVHPDNVDIRAGLEVGAGKGPVEASGGISASTLRGTKTYGKLSLTGNEYIDNWKKEAADKAASWINTPDIFTRDLWSGEYQITEGIKK